MTYLTNQIIEIGSEKLSDHGRAPLSVTVERFENSQRMHNARLRRNVIAKKLTWSTSWENLPARADVNNGPVDGGMSGEEMRDFHNATDGPFDISIQNGDETAVQYRVMITEFSYDIVKRGEANDLWSVNLTFTEV